MKERVKGAFTKKKIFHFLKMALFVVALSLILLSLLGTVAHATGLVDDTINAENLYSKYPLSNYQLDFYVDNSWSWLPWNWLDGIGKSVQYGLYCITNFVWTISLYLSNATGYVVQEAYKLDFINDMAAAYAASDLVISRAGAGSISEFCLLHKPVVLVPSPNVAEDHQTKNALALVDKQAAIYVKDSEAEAKLMDVALKTVADDQKLKELSDNIAKLALPDSARIIAQEVIKLAETENK